MGMHYAGPRALYHSGVRGFFYLYGPFDACGPLMFFEDVPLLIPGLLVVVRFPFFLAMFLQWVVG